LLLGLFNLLLRFYNSFLVNVLRGQVLII
jgi:hypothetical protein